VPDEELPAAQHLAEWKQGVSACLEFRLRRRDRSKLWVQNRVDPMFDERGQFVGAVGTVTDISERRYAQAERQANEERFRTAFNQASVGMSHATLKDGRILTVNERFAQITGYGARDLTGMTELDLTHPGDREAESGLFRRLVAGNIPCYSHEKRYVRRRPASCLRARSLSNLAALILQFPARSRRPFTSRAACRELAPLRIRSCPLLSALNKRQPGSLKHTRLSL
jgi:PAS domain S-box-containing protein